MSTQRREPLLPPSPIGPRLLTKRQRSELVGDVYRFFHCRTWRGMCDWCGRYVKAGTNECRRCARMPMDTIHAADAMAERRDREEQSR